MLVRLNIVTRDGCRSDWEGDHFVSHTIHDREKKKRTVNRLSTSTVVVGKVTTLAHELRDNSVKGRALKVQSYQKRGLASVIRSVVHGERRYNQFKIKIFFYHFPFHQCREHESFQQF